MGGWASFQEKQEEERAMGVFFAKEILEAGVQIETRGHAFYQAMAQKAQSESARKLFLELARDEKDHLRSLEELLPHLMDPPDTWEREEFGMYLAELAESHVFGKEEGWKKSQEALETDIQALDLGIRFEKDSVLFMEALSQMARPQEKAVVGKLIQWEKEHLLKLVRAKWQLLGRAR
jgi:rubrerythrin